ncbi:TPA: hypothetical protein QCX01_002918 [Bacillus toyonensis]|nr:hypothetical protein [Bacillus toyonensis]HDR7835212.1 hypothetical protein [Bacillus toyonensis]
MKNYNDQLQDIYDKLIPAFEHLKENRDTCTSDLISNLIGIDCSQKNSIPDILNSICFKGVIFDFFNLILSRMNISPIINKEMETSFVYTPYRFLNEEGKINYVPTPPSSNEFDTFQEHLISDLKILLLKDAVLNLSSNHPEYIYEERKKELFFEFPEFKTKICDLAKSLNFKDNELAGLQTTIEQFSDFIHFRALKISFPWIAYSLCKTYTDLPINNKKSEFYLVREKNLALKSLGRNLYQQSYQTDLVLAKAQEDFSFFSEYLKHYCNRHYPTTNESLSIYLFNEITNLLDLHILFTDFSSRAINSNYDDSNTAKLQINKHFESLSKLCLINPLGVKCYLLNILENEEIYSDENLWLTLNKLCSIITVYIYSIIEENNLVEKHNSLSIDHFLYDQLYEEEPYNIEWVTRTLDIYAEDSSLQLKAAYFYAYKNLYDTKFRNKKNQYPYENY